MEPIATPDTASQPNQPIRPRYRSSHYFKDRDKNLVAMVRRYSIVSFSQLLNLTTAGETRSWPKILRRRLATLTNNGYIRRGRHYSTDEYIYYGDGFKLPDILYLPHELMITQFLIENMESIAMHLRSRA